MNRITIRYSEPLLREAVRQFVLRAVLRHMGWRLFLGIGLVGAGLILQLQSGDHGWFVGVLAATLVFVGAFMALLYRAHFRNTVGRFRQMKVPECTLIFTEKDLTLTTELGSSALPWSTIAEVWQFPRFWLILFSRSQFVTLPLDSLDEEARAFISRKTRKDRA